jgi:hypothetical protein
MALFWFWSRTSVPNWKQEGWKAVFRSLLGYVWFGFGVHFVIRFLLLNVDSYVFGNMTSRLADIAPEVVDLTLLLALGYFAALVLAYRIGKNHIAALMHLPVDLPAENSESGQVLIAGMALVGIVGSSGFLPVPLALFTPLGIVGSLWVIPAVFVWFERFKAGPSASSPMLWILLLPGFIRAVLSPYRENLLAPVLVIVLAWTFAGRRVRPVAVVASLLALYLGSTIIISAYREVLWEDVPVQQAIENATRGHTLELRYDAKWVEAVRRFHGFDSLLLTVNFVPDYIPHSNRNVLVDALLRGVVPRAVYEDKETSNRGLLFGQSIWNYDSPEVDSDAAIAPSMAGDLYEANGTVMVLLGGAFWGLLLGMLEAWKRRVSPKANAALIAVFLFQCFASVERDYAHVVSTVIQYLIVMYLVAKIVGTRKVASYPDRIRGTFRG